MLSFIRIDRKPYRWFINQAHRKLLEANLIGNEPLIYEAASKNIIKDNSARTIFPMDLPGMNLIVKRYKIKNLIEKFKATFISKAHQEMKSAGHLIQQHINTAYPFGVMETRKWGFVVEVFVFLKKIDNVVTLKEFLVQPVSVESKDNLLQALGELIRKVHQARFFHKDLHIGNIMINPESLRSEMPDLYLIDLHRSSVQPHFAQSYGVYNLAQMVYSLSKVLPLTDAYRFVKNYRELDFRRNIFRDFIRMVFVQVEELRHKHWRSRNKRCLKNSSGYARMKIRNKTRWESVFIDRRFNREDIFGLIDRHDKMAAQEPDKLLKRTDRRSISVLRNGTADVIIKEYRYSVWAKILSFLGIHPAKKEWFSASGLNVRDVETVEPVALVEKRDLFFTWVNKSYVITKKIDAQPTNQFLMRSFSRPIKDKDALGNKIRFIRQFALAVKRLHQKGIFHHDLKANNVIIKDEREKKRDGSNTSLISHLSSFLFYFIDLDRVSFNRETTLEERVINLAQLNAAVTDVVSKTDRLRFYRFYSYGEECLPWKDRKDIVRQVMQATVKRRHFWPLPG
ncbi:MAG TPA: lipopolysaccharide kinase InaA family protein [Planctomycetota bacterium]|nr:lipopolysaccharide kinase InaA family protein [Planctomycetota bacterium]